MIRIGTAGFAYADWHGPYYPIGLPPAQRLSYYAQDFSVCEINSSYYRIPSAKLIEGLIGKAGSRMVFVIKLFQGFTHQRTAVPSDLAAFREGLAPLVEAGRLGAVLAQFPYAFKRSVENQTYLAGLRDRLGPEYPWVVEFRHRSWLSPHTWDFLRQNSLGFVNVDEPDLPGLMPRTDLATGQVGYIRFHGRNAQKWFASAVQPWERYDYTYTTAELESWLPAIQNLAQKTSRLFVIFNNHWQSQAVANAKTMIQLVHRDSPELLQEESAPHGRSV